MKYTFILNTAGVVLSLGSLHTPHGADVHLRHSDSPHARGPYTLVSSTIQNELVKAVLDDRKAEGRAEGREEGEMLAKIAMARKLLARNRLTLDEIIEDTGLTRAEIEALQRGEILPIEHKAASKHGAATTASAK